MRLFCGWTLDPEQSQFEKKKEKEKITVTVIS
jgi:hypothetical protein